MIASPPAVPAFTDSAPLTPTHSNGDSLDWQGISSEEITRRVLSRTKSGSILLFHNGAKHTPEALPNIITALKNQGFRFVKLSELLLDGDYLLDSNGEQHPVATDTDAPGEESSAPPREAEL
jgi:peptidoglycan/xylan/chitin deacetylase (PgdA/CDA1 family)